MLRWTCLVTLVCILTGACASTGSVDDAEARRGGELASDSIVNSTSVSSPSPATSSTPDPSDAKPSSDTGTDGSPGSSDETTLDGLDAVPICASMTVGFEVDGELGESAWLASAQLNRAAVGLPSDVVSVTEVSRGLTARHLVANDVRTEDDQTSIRDAFHSLREPAFQEELGGLQWSHPEYTGGLFPIGNRKLAVTYTSAGRATVLGMVDRAERAVEAGTSDLDLDLVAIEVERSIADLEEIREQLAARLPDWWLRIENRFNAVSVDMGFAEQSDSERWPPEAPMHGVCLLTGDRPGDFAPQPGDGDGWRLLSITDSAVAEVAVAGDDRALDDLWAALEIPDDRPTIDFNAEIVAAFNHARGFPPACDRVFFAGVVFEEHRVSGQPEAVSPAFDEVCLAIGLPRSFVVAVDRARLPDSPFALHRSATPQSFDSEHEQIEVDLRGP